MSQENSSFDSDELAFTEVRHGEVHFKRTGKLKTTGITVVESILDEQRREV